jgi:transcription elongation factor SPT5
VRIKRGKYTGDLAQVESVQSNGLDVELRLVPRLDYGLNEDINAPMVSQPDRGGGPTKRKRPGMTNSLANRPPQRLFSETEAKKKHLKYLVPQGQRGWQYQGEMYKDGFLIKDFKLHYLISEDVNPTLEEVTKFASNAEDGSENLDLGALAATLRAGKEKGAYVPGDMVEVFDGEQKGIYGKVASILNGIASIAVSEGILEGQKVEIPVKSLRKRFREGDHVKVIGGSKYRDDVGMVVRIADDKVTLVSDQSMNEITVFSKDLREATDSGRAGGFGNYDLHDLVQLE